MEESNREIIKGKLRQCFDGRIVRKDLTKKIKEGANVPVYVLEFLLGQYCCSDDDEVIEKLGVADKILAISKLSNEIVELKIKLSELKNTKKCPDCGANISKNSAYCNICGSKII